MLIHYNDEKHYVRFCELHIGDIFITSIEGNNYAWIKVETSHTDESKVEFNAVCLDTAGVTLIAHNTEVVISESCNMAVNFF